jgi:hypothetical protein
MSASWSAAWVLRLADNCALGQGLWPAVLVCLLTLFCFHLCCAHG